jgi:peptidoglycan/xylan/chitin deacetylase (PgdA/CDA1 family)
VHTHTNTQNWVQSREWVLITLQWGDVNSGTGTYGLDAAHRPNSQDGFTDMRFQVIDAGTGPVTVRLQEIDLVDDTKKQYPDGLVSVTFDDSWRDVFTNGRPAMEKYGIPGTTYTIADQVGRAGRYKLKQLKAAQDQSGWEIAGHAYAGAAHGARYDGLTAEQVDTDVHKLRSWMAGNGFTSKSFAYPGGRFGQTTDGVNVESIVARYFSTGRSIIAEDNRENVRPPMPLRLRSLTGISSVTKSAANPASLTAQGGLLDRAQLAGGWLILCFHRVVTTTPKDSTEIHKDDFAAVMKAIKTRGMTALPVGDVVR